MRSDQAPLQADLARNNVSKFHRFQGFKENPTGAWFYFETLKL
jgi:hypothetical protein